MEVPSWLRRQFEVRVREPRETSGWNVIGGYPEGEVIPALPEDLWELRWEDTGSTVMVADPLYGNERSLAVHDVISSGEVTRFAYAEITPGTYLFALPDLDSNQEPAP